MAIAPIPVSRYLVPAGPPSAPEEFATVDQKIVTALPLVLNLEQNLDLVLVVPTGLGKSWGDADPVTIVSQSKPELDPYTPAADLAVGTVAHAPVRLIVRYKAANISVAPLIAGYQGLLPSSDSDAGIKLDLIALQWDIRAGNLRGAGDYGSRITLAWKHADRGVNNFGPLPMHPYVKPRLYLRYLQEIAAAVKPRLVWIESDLGVLHAEALRRFQSSKTVLT